VIFVDTSFWVGLYNARDRHHPEAATLLDQQAGRPLLTSDQVRGETWTYLRRKAGHRAAVSFLDVLEASPRVSVEAVIAADQDHALAWLRQHDEREYSFVDATSFALMRRRRLRDAFAFDGDFAAAGFTELRPV
jgi:predicted nucleic acid-binding protein